MIEFLRQQALPLFSETCLHGLTWSSRPSSGRSFLFGLSADVWLSILDGLGPMQAKDEQTIHQMDVHGRLRQCHGRRREAKVHYRVLKHLLCKCNEEFMEQLHQIGIRDALRTRGLLSIARKTASNQQFYSLCSRRDILEQIEAANKSRKWNEHQLEPQTRAAPTRKATAEAVADDAGEETDTI